MTEYASRLSRTGAAVLAGAWLCGCDPAVGPISPPGAPPGTPPGAVPSTPGVGSPPGQPPPPGQGPVGGTGAPTPGPGAPTAGAGAVPPADAGTAPPLDAGIDPSTDAGTAPPMDAGIDPSTDAGTAPPPDAGMADAGNPPSTDAGIPGSDGGTTEPDAGTPESGSPGCGKAPPLGGADSVVVAGTSRTYQLWIPPGYDRNRTHALVFGHHGATGTGAIAQFYFGIQQAAGSEAIVVYPDALVNGGITAWRYSPLPGAAEDLAFFDALRAKLLDSLCIDSKRVFTTGHSSGGYFSNYLACERADVLRGVAPVAGGGPFALGCKGPIAAWIMASTDDTIVSYTAGEGSRDRWRSQNGCSLTTTPVGPGACVAYTGCAPDRPVHWCLETDQGHDWPAYAGAAIWDFFSAL